LWQRLLPLESLRHRKPLAEVTSNAGWAAVNAAAPVQRGNICKSISRPLAVLSGDVIAPRSLGKEDEMQEATPKRFMRSFRVEVFGTA
jgi:hypothetical protein